MDGWLYLVLGVTIITGFGGTLINALGYDDEKINAFAQATLAKLLDDSLSGGDLTALALETGKFGVDVMALLDKANTETYGNPELEL